MFSEMFLPYRPSDWKGLIPEFLEAEQKRLAGKKFQGLQNGESSENTSEFLIDIKWLIESSSSAGGQVLERGSWGWEWRGQI